MTEMRWLDGIINSMDLSLSKFQVMLNEDRKAWHAESMGLQRVGQDLGTEKQQQCLCVCVCVCVLVDHSLQPHRL